jgi:hypothetical protein
VTATLVIVCAVLLLYVLLLLVSQFAPASQPAGESGSPAERTLQELRLDLPSRSLGESICSSEDLEFVTNDAPELRQQFLRERKEIMLLWLRDIRCVVVQTMGLYRTAIRTSPSVQPVVEIRIGLNYLSFLLFWELARGFVWLQSPIVSRHIALRVFGIAQELSLAMGQMLAPLDPILLARMRSDWQGRTT